MLDSRPNERLLMGRKESNQTALVSLQFCAGWTEPLLLDNVISAKISCVDSFRIIQLNTDLDKKIQCKIVNISLPILLSIICFVCSKEPSH